jgi:hypothetical protein
MGCIEFDIHICGRADQWWHFVSVRHWQAQKKLWQEIFLPTLRAAEENIEKPRS